MMLSQCFLIVFTDVKRPLRPGPGHVERQHRLNMNMKWNKDRQRKSGSTTSVDWRKQASAIDGGTWADWDCVRLRKDKTVAMKRRTTNKNKWRIHRAIHLLHFIVIIFTIKATKEQITVEAKSWQQTYRRHNVNMKKWHTYTKLVVSSSGWVSLGHKVKSAVSQSVVGGWKPDRKQTQK